MNIVSIVPEHPQGLPIANAELLANPYHLYDHLLTQPHRVEHIGTEPIDITPEKTALDAIRIYMSRRDENIVTIDYHHMVAFQDLARSSQVPSKTRYELSPDPFHRVRIGNSIDTYPIIGASDYFNTRFCLYRLITSL